MLLEPLIKTASAMGMEADIVRDWVLEQKKLEEEKEEKLKREA